MHLVLLPSFQHHDDCRLVDHSVSLYRLDSQRSNVFKETQEKDKWTSRDREVSK